MSGERLEKYERCRLCKKMNAVNAKLFLNLTIALSSGCAEKEVCPIIHNIVKDEGAVS